MRRLRCGYTLVWQWGTLYIAIYTCYAHAHTHTHTHTHTVSQSTCQQDASLHVDIFQEVISNFTGIAQQLTPAPTFRGVDLSTPAYEFRGRGSGIHLSSRQFSESIRRASCANNEFTFYTSIFFRDSNSDGPVFELWYPGDVAGNLPVLAVYMNAGADEITIMYR